MNKIVLYNIILWLLFLITLFVYYFYCRISRKKQIGQEVRLEGPKSHYIKNKTPVMGGVVFVIFFIITSVYFLKINPYNLDFKLIDLLIIYLPMLINFIIGLIDDLKILKKHSNEGIAPLKKFIFQFLCAFIMFVILLINKYNSKINFFGKEINIFIFYYLICLFLYLSFPNAVNLTDGLDGLASGITIIILLFLLIFCKLKNEILLFNYIYIFLLMILSFYIFNIKKAWIFMGDSGSLAIGAFLSSLFILLKIEILIIFMCFIFIVETMSVIIQVLYFKISGGKRILKMAPLHHHLELSGFSENSINLIFYSITFVLSLLAICLGVKLF